jgi:hypothetical protein
MCQGVGKKIIKHIMPNFVFKLWPGGLTDHSNHRVMASSPYGYFSRGSIGVQGTNSIAFV